MWRARSVADPIRLFGFPRFSGFTLPGLCDNRRPAHIIPETKSSIKRRPAVLESIKREEKRRAADPVGEVFDPSAKS